MQRTLDNLVSRLRKTALLKVTPLYAEGPVFTVHPPETGNGEDRSCEHPKGFGSSTLQLVDRSHELYDAV